MPYEPLDLNPTHEIAFVSDAVFAAVAALGEAVVARNAALIGLSVTASPEGHRVKARLMGVDPDAARALTDHLAQRPDVSFAAVEHVIWRRPQ